LLSSLWLSDTPGDVIKCNKDQLFPGEIFPKQTLKENTAKKDQPASDQFNSHENGKCQP